ncbi:MAG: hypothetical protein FWF98_01735 [Dehalococcoidia bacterium]|nr:hypothetical protein [Dehalococcoidia bacterium]
MKINPSVVVYRVGDTYAAYDSTITLNSASQSDEIIINKSTVQAESCKKFLVLNITITAKEDIVLINERFQVHVLDVVADAELSKSLNNNIDYLCSYTLMSGEIITIDVVFQFDVEENAMYAVGLHEALFQVTT